MGVALRHEFLSLAEYFAGEEFAPRKREYLAGEVYPMPDSSARHNRITLNLYVALHAAASGTPFELFVLDVKLPRSDHRVVYYPDVMLVGNGNDAPPSTAPAPASSPKCSPLPPQASTSGRSGCITATFPPCATTC